LSPVAGGGEAGTSDGMVFKLTKVSEVSPQNPWALGQEKLAKSGMANGAELNTGGPALLRVNGGVGMNRKVD